jgi:hypothetical protein
MYRGWGQRQACIGFWWVNPRVYDHWQDPDVRMWDYDSGMDLQEVECVGMDWIRLAQDRGRQM